jgi:hypothetical protein
MVYKRKDMLHGYLPIVMCFSLALLAFSLASRSAYNALLGKLLPGPPFFDISILLLGLYNIAPSFWYGWGGSRDRKRAPSRLEPESGLFHINLLN